MFAASQLLPISLFPASAHIKAAETVTIRDLTQTVESRFVLPCCSQQESLNLDIICFSVAQHQSRSRRHVHPC